VVTERAAPPPLFGLAPHGVCPAGRITPPAVRSYRTLSPLPAETGGIFSVALSVKSACSKCAMTTLYSREEDLPLLRMPEGQLRYFTPS
jgi:hypothetical protein